MGSSKGRRVGGLSPGLPNGAASSPHQRLQQHEAGGGWPGRVKVLASSTLGNAAREEGSFDRASPFLHWVSWQIRSCGAASSAGLRTAPTDSLYLLLCLLLRCVVLIEVYPRMLRSPSSYIVPAVQQYQVRSYYMMFEILISPCCHSK